MTQKTLTKGTEQKVSLLGASLGLFMLLASPIALVNAFVPPTADQDSVISTVSDFDVHVLTGW